MTLDGIQMESFRFKVGERPSVKVELMHLNGMLSIWIGNEDAHPLNNLQIAYPNVGGKLLLGEDSEVDSNQLFTKRLSQKLNVPVLCSFNWIDPLLSQADSYNEIFKRISEHIISNKQ